MKITGVHGRRVWDSRGRPTVEAEIRLEDGTMGRAIAPAGASTGTGEAVDLRDGGGAFGGLDVRQAVGNVNSKIATALRGLDSFDQAGVDARLIGLDETPTKAWVGGNAMIAVSMAVAHAAAASRREPLWRSLGATTHHRRRQQHSTQTKWRVGPQAIGCPPWPKHCGNRCILYIFSLPVSG